jgi:ABC-type antimicrobial peptide transport system permease subunit
VARDVVREVAVLLAAGAGVGALLATVVLLAMRSLHSPVIGFVAFNPGIDPLALVAIAAFIVIVGAAAAFMPVRRAVSMNPLAALRTE